MGSLLPKFEQETGIAVRSISLYFETLDLAGIVSVSLISGNFFDHRSHGGDVEDCHELLWILFAADEIQPKKLPNMKTHVSTWTIQAKTAPR